MEADVLDLPPLNGIRAFEAAARTGSFTRAAAELRVTSAAVSQQVRLLEEHFNKQLFVRQGNRLTLTDAGHAVLPQTTRALSNLAAVSARLLEPDLRSRLVVSAPYSLAELWLAPKLAQVAALHPGMPIEIRAEEDPVQFSRHEIDVRVSYGPHHYPNMRATQLVHDSVLAVCAPKFWHSQRLGVTRLSELPDDKFIHIDWGPAYASHPSWADWFLASGLSRVPDPARGPRMTLSALAIMAARHELGVALGQKTMTRIDLEEHRLIAVSTVTVPVGQPYVAFVPALKAERPLVRMLLQLLRSPQSSAAGAS